MAHEGLVIYFSLLVMLLLPTSTQLFLSFLDLVIINTANIVLSLAVSPKQDTFFQEQQDDGIKINKVMNQYYEQDLKGVHVGDIPKGNESHDNIFEQQELEDEQFSLSISDKDDDFIGRKEKMRDNPTQGRKIGKNISLVYDPSAGQDSGNMMNRQDAQQLGSRNQSAIYSKELSPAKRVKVQESVKISGDILQKIKGNSNKVEQHQNIFAEMRGADDQLVEANQYELKDEGKGDQSNLQVENQELLFEGVEPVREIKVYKGRGLGGEDEPEGIDLTISKKQRELIELRKSIRRRERERERSLDRKSRKNKSVSKDKRQRSEKIELPWREEVPHAILDSKGAALIEQGNRGGMVSELPVNSGRNREEIQDEDMIQQSKILGNKDQKMRQYAAKIEQKIDKDVSEILRRQQRNLDTNIYNIEDDIQQQVSNIYNKNVGKSSIIDEQIAANKSSILKKQATQQPTNIMGEQISNQVPFSRREGASNLSANSFMRDQSPLRQKTHLTNIIQQEIPHSPSRANVLEEAGEASFTSEREGRGLIPQDGQQLISHIKKSARKKLREQSQERELGWVGENRRISGVVMEGDEDNFPLENKLKNLSKHSIYDQNRATENQEALLEILQQADREKRQGNRNYLKKAKKQQQPVSQHSSYQELNDTSTVKESSQKEITQRRMENKQKPPLHNRPATSQKSRMYIAGLKQFQESSQRKEERSDKRNMTSIDMRFRPNRSRQLHQDLESEPYPTFSSNQLPQRDVFDGLGNELPRKPTIGPTTRKNKYLYEQEDRVKTSSAQRSMKSYRSRSIDRQQLEEQLKRNELGEDLQDYYKRKKSPSHSKSRSRSKDKNKSSSKRLSELQKIYLQRLQFKK